MHFLFVYFQRSAVSKISVELFIWGKCSGFGPCPHTHQKKKCFHFLGSTSNFCLCNKQVLKPGLSHLERICVPAHSPQRSFFEAREASALFPYLRLWLSKAARHVLQPYWTWGLQDGLQRRLNAVKGEVAPHAAASVSRCWKEPVTDYINGMILEINFLQHFVSV